MQGCAPLMARFVPLFLFFLAACGNSLQVPEDIPITHLPAGEDFVLTVVMETCSDPCATYEEPTCSVDVDEKDMVIEIDASVGFDSGSSDCAARGQCGPMIFAHCDVDALPEGTYSVRSGGFEALIFLEQRPE
jgi:hypothetical protein